MESMAILFTGIVIGIAFTMVAMYLSDIDRIHRSRRELDRNIREAIERSKDRERRKAVQVMN